MAGSALKRLMQEYKGCVCSICLKKVYYHGFIIFVELSNNSPEGILAGPKSDDNFFEWEALIT